MKNNSYKRTEIGEIPEGWNLLMVKDFAELRRESYIPNDNEDLPYVGLEHINQDSLSLNGIGSSSETISNKYRFYKDDVLFGKLRPYFRKVYQPDFEGVCSTDIWVLKPKEKNDARFLFYFTANYDFVNLASLGSTGTKMPRANWDQIKNSQWPVPIFGEQQQIASILSSLGDKIELNRKMSQILEEIGKALFKHWFVDFEFPNGEGKPYKSSGGEMVNSEFGEIPREWEVKSLDEIAVFLNGLVCQKYPPTDKTDSLPVIKIAELRRGFTESSDKASSKVEEKYHVNNGDVLFSWSGSLELCLWQYDIGILNQHLFKVTSENFPKWLYYFWILEYLPEFRTIASGKATTMGHIQRKHLTNAKVLVPDEPSFDLMSLVMSPVIEKIITNSREINSLRIMGNSLLPRLMSGRLRV